MAPVGDAALRPSGRGTCVILALEETKALASEAVPPPEADFAGAGAKDRLYKGKATGESRRET
jgi:hypothetical protein